MPSILRDPRLSERAQPQPESRPFDRPFRIETFFLGRSRASGVFHDRFGTLRTRFVAEIEGAFEGDEFVLAERFLYDDGRRESRTWRIRPHDGGTYHGRADDIVGLATGQATASSIDWRYVLSLKIGARRWNMNFEDSFLLVGDMVINRARMSKFGIRLGEATIVFRREDD